MKILLVEDDTIAAMAAESLLTERLNCTVDIAKNGISAVKLAQENNYTLILMDIGLPDISGFEAAARIKKTNQEIPIIALTGNTNDETKTKGLSVGMSEILEKPLTPKKLQSVFAQIKA